MKRPCDSNGRKKYRTQLKLKSERKQKPFSNPSLLELLFFSVEPDTAFALCIAVKRDKHLKSFSEKQWGQYCGTHLPWAKKLPHIVSKKTSFEDFVNIGIDFVIKFYILV